MPRYDTYFLMKEADVIDYVQTKYPGHFDKDAALTVKEIGDGNLNYVFRVVEEKTGKSIIVKQAGEALRISAEMKVSTDRNRIESEILQIQDKYAPGLVPKIYGYDTVMCACAMEDLSDHALMRYALMRHETFPRFAEDISTSTATIISEGSLTSPGVTVEQGTTRSYPNGSMAAHILGHVGPLTEANIAEFEEQGIEYSLDDIIGQDGLEQLYESELRGEDGERLVYVNEDGEVTDTEISVEPQAGNTVMLTLDNRLQTVAEQALVDQIHYLNENAAAGQGREANAGAVCAIDIKTGEVLVLASYPTYDPNTLSENYAALSADENRPLRNRALLETYTPGSIFKPVVALAGLAGGVIDAASTVTCTQVYNYYVSEYGAAAFTPTCLGYHGVETVVDALRVSCNIFFYDVGRRVGIDAIEQSAISLGLGQDNGFELWTNPGTISTPAAAEAAGEGWYYGDVLQSSIGQRFNRYTPLQLAAYAMNIANRGTQNKVTILKEIKDDSMTQTLYEHETEVLQESPYDPSVFDPIIQGMVEASRVGTAAYYFGSYPVDVASKTGTPETADLPNSTFICFAPADDPQIAISVVIEQGWHGYTGAPVARAILDAYFSSDVTAEEPTQSGTLLP